jgi:tRNA A-37 threonylcarbamoyl transferase component Bud32
MGDATLGTSTVPSTDPELLAPGQIVGEFRIESQLGRGAMGTVYGVVHMLIGKRGAMKVLRRELCTDANEIMRFIQEARAVNQIGHPNIVDVFAFGALPDGRSYLVMEWLVGETLRARIRRGLLPRAEIRDVLVEIVRALEAAHAKGIIHRDLKPDNVFLVEVDGERPRAKLLDFGVAKLTGPENLAQTRMGGMLGTPQYIAPEQARGEATMPSDIYSLGIMFYELLAGRPPFLGESSLDVVRMHMMEPPPIMKFAAVSESLEKLLDAMLAKDPADRPSLAQVRAGLAELTPDRAQSVQVVRKSRGLQVALLIGLAIAGGLVAYLVTRPPARDEVAVGSQPVDAAIVAPADAAPVAVDAVPRPHAVDAAPQPVADPQDGFVVVKAPAGATVLIDDEDKAYRTGVRYALAWGKHTVTIKYKGNLKKDTIEVQAGKLQVVSFQGRTGAQSKEPVTDPYNNAPR